MRSGVNAKKSGEQKQQILGNLAAGSGAGAAPGSGAGAAPKANGAQPNANQQPAVVPMAVPTTQLVPQNRLAQNQGNGRVPQMTCQFPPLSNSGAINQMQIITHQKSCMSRSKGMQVCKWCEPGTMDPDAVVQPGGLNQLRTFQPSVQLGGLVHNACVLATSTCVSVDNHPFALNPAGGYQGKYVPVPVNQIYPVLVPQPNPQPPPAPAKKAAAPPAKK